MNYRKTIKISKAKAEHINKLLTVQPKSESECFGENEMHSEDVTFSNGIRMCIDLCGVQYEENGDNTAWTQAVLYDSNGIELTFTEPAFDYLGEWTIPYEGDNYTVVVELED